MFTFKPAPKNGSATNGNGHGPNGNGHGGNGNGNGSVNGNGNGHSAPAAVEQPVSSTNNGNGNGHPNGNGANHSHSNGNGHTAAPLGQTLAGWLGLGKANGNGNGHAAPRPAPARKDNNGYKIDSVIGPGIHFKGTLTGSGGLRIEGTFDGSINIQGPLLITDGAKVTADVRAGAVSVGGSLKGDVVAVKVEILSTGRIWGDIVTTAFATEEGAFLRGQVRMEDDVPPDLPGPEPTVEPGTGEAPAATA